MAQQTINIGTTANDGTGDPLRTAFDKVNSNFTELYNDESQGEVNSIIAGDGISVDTATGNVTVTNTITNNNQLTNGAGYVDGSGTANKLPKFTDSDTIGNSTITDDGTNVSITGDFTADAIYLNDMTLGSGALYYGADRLTLANYNPTGSVYIETGGGSYAMVLDENQNVGIGTSSPDARFSVVSSSPNSTAAKIGGIEYGGSQRGLTIKTFQSLGGDDCGVEFNAAEGLAGYGSFVFKADTTERMRIDSSGNVGIGTSSPSANLDVNLNAQFNKSSTDGGFVNILGNNSYIAIGADKGGGAVLKYNSNGNLDITPRSGFNTVFTSGNVGIGTSSPTTKLDVVGTYRMQLRTDDAIPELRATTANGAAFKELGLNGSQLVFNTSSTERMRIDSAGALLIGKSNYSVATNGLIIDNPTMNNSLTHSIPNGVSINTYHVYNTTDASYKFYVKSNGGVANYSANDTNLSDERTKTDINPLGSYWDKFKALELVTFKYKNQDHNDDNIGLIAQQVESVAPEFVCNDGFKELEPSEEPLKSIYTTDLYHAAIKVLQEAMSKIETLESEIEILKTK